MSNSVLFTDNVVFESIEHLNMFSNVEVKLPDNTPIDCNLVCYSVSGDEIDFFTLYREADDGLYSLVKGGWEYSSESLQAEVEFDKVCLARRYIYVQVNRKTPKEETKEIVMSKFKVGDKVRCVSQSAACGVEVGSIYTVKNPQLFESQIYNGVYCMELLEVGSSPYDKHFELVQENTTTIQAIAKKKDDDLFTPECLVGVETNYGHITMVLIVSFGSAEYFNPSLYVYTTESLSKEDLKDVHNLKYYISDESDETVSFTEYVEMFYDGWA